ncbi:MAG: Unknown protein [uncultured Sulfurovum sp.]|uniref:Schlafen AlbA-2 domain-containing protein n=1 Tax=uncultured Sulfurovum sp. TaxID=269237 RepID=A0A6S6TWP2_9BACT|nr:MAG: Unknown protein [uncultured Sulfurovum sp.]
MTINEVHTLIAKNESPKLDFKRQWYKKEELKTELIKDIIALANGNIHTIGHPSYLIIGIKENSNGNELYDVETESNLETIKKQLLQNLQKYATPAIHDLTIEKFMISSKNIVVITIPFHPYLIILKEKLRQFSKDTLLYRAGEGTVSADYATRKTFEDAINRYVQKNEDTTNLTTRINKYTPDESEYYGAVDYMKITTKRLQDISSILKFVSQRQKVYNDLITKSANEINLLKKSSNQKNMSQVQKIFKLLSNDTMKYANFINSQLSILSDSRQDIFNSIKKIIELTTNVKVELIHSFYKTEFMKQAPALNLMIHSTSLFKKGLQQNFLTAEMNKSSQVAIKALENLVYETELILQQIEEL